MRFYNLISPKISDCRDTVTALIGGGGKTGLLHKIANELAENYPKVLQTSLTKTAFTKSENPMVFKDDFDIKSVDRNPLFIVGEKISESKLLGISETQLDDIRKYFDLTIYECDGAKNKPLKAHTDHDPIVPKFTTNVIIIVGADVIDSKISDGLVHRPELFCKLWNVDKDRDLDIDFIVKVVSSPDGYLSKVIGDATIAYFVNKADSNYENAERLAQKIYNKTNKPTFFGSISNSLLKQVH